MYNQFIEELAGTPLAEIFALMDIGHFVEPGEPIDPEVETSIGTMTTFEKAVYTWLITNKVLFKDLEPALDYSRGRLYQNDLEKMAESARALRLQEDINFVESRFLPWIVSGRLKYNPKERLDAIKYRQGFRIVKLDFLKHTRKLYPSC